MAVIQEEVPNRAFEDRRRKVQYNEKRLPYFLTNESRLDYLAGTSTRGHEVNDRRCPY